MSRTTRAVRWLPWFVAVAGCGNGALLPIDAADGPPPVGEDAAVDAAAPDAAAPDAGAPCPAAGGPTMHGGAIAADEVWSAEGNPHVVTTTDLVIAPRAPATSATLTLAPCAEVHLPANGSITIRAGGALVGAGTVAQPVRVRAADPGAPFAQIHPHSGGTIRLTYTAIDDGGAPGNNDPQLIGTFDLQGDFLDPGPEPTIFVDHVILRRSRSNGVVLRDGAGFAPGSTNLVVDGAARFPILTWARSVGTLPSGTYGGNGADEIAINANGRQDAIIADTTMRALGVPYRIGLHSGANLRVGTDQPDGAVATLTIEPGVTLRFAPRSGGPADYGAGMYVQFGGADRPATGALIAVGTEAAPIVFTSAADTPAAGDWFGVWFGAIPDPASRVDHARIEYAGSQTNAQSIACAPGGPSYSGAIRIFGAPPGEFVTHTEIVHSGGNGVDRGWRTDDAPASFLPTNTITDLAGCRETFPRRTNNACPDPVPCP